MKKRLAALFPCWKRKEVNIVLPAFFILTWLAGGCIRKGVPTDLTQEERQWLTTFNGKIRLGTEHIYDLYNSDDEGVYNGVSSDYIKLIEEKLHFRFQIVRTDNWFDENTKVAQREIDVLASVAGTTRLSRYMFFTPPYFHFPAFLIRRKQTSPTTGGRLFAGKVILYLENEELKKYLMERFSGSRIEMAADPLQGLRDVSLMRADAIVLSKVMATFYIKQGGIANLYIAEPLGYSFSSSIASRNDWPILNRILSKGLSMITTGEKEAIQKRWGLKKYFWNTPRFWYTMLTFFSLVGFSMAIVLIWNRTLRRKVLAQTCEIRRELEERKTIQGELQNSRNRYNLLADATFEAILLLENSCIVDANLQATRMLGDGLNGLRGRSLSEFVLSEEMGTVNLYLNDEGDDPCEFRMVLPDCSVIEVEARMKPLHEKGREGRFVVIRDISDRLRVQKEAQRQREQLFQADKMISLGILVSGVAHEINNPNNAIALNSGLLKETWKGMIPILTEYCRLNPDASIGGFNYKDLSKVVPEILDSLLKNSQRIQNIVDGLKDFSRQDSGLQTTKLDLNETVREGISLMKRLIDKHTHQFRMNLADYLPVMQGNRQKIEQVVINLVQNACLALPDPERGLLIQTRFEPGERMIHLIVRDEGIGITEKDLRYIEEPFFTTRRAEGGVGLGLFVTKKIVADHQGRIVFTSVPGLGTTVDACFPATSSPETKEEAKHD